MTSDATASGATRGKRTLAVDIGGSGVKMMLLDAAGQPSSARLREPTPDPSTPEAILSLISRLSAGVGRFDRASAAFPGVVRGGITETAHNLDPAWIGFALAKELSSLLGKPARAANDADVQGFGAVEGRGVELVVTLGTGFGSALFYEGVLVPNLELAHHVFRKNKTYEDYLGRAALKADGKKKWNRILERALTELRNLFNFDRLYIGGGNAEEITFDLPEDVRVVPNVEGLLGGIALWRDHNGSAAASR